MNVEYYLVFHVLLCPQGMGFYMKMNVEHRTSNVQ